MNVKTIIVLTLLLFLLFTGTTQAGLVKPYSKGMSQVLRTHRNKINLAHVEYVCEHGWGRVKREHCRAEKWLKRLLAPPPIDSRWAVVLPYNWVLNQIAQCESEGNWYIATGNNFYGGLQFDLGTWQSVGGSGYPNENSELEQKYRAVLLIQQRGYSPWPVCGSR